MPGVHIVTDSACDLPPERTEALGVEVVPLIIRFGDDEFVDRTELTPTDFYARMAATSTLPATAAPAPGVFEAAFRRCARAGADAVVCIDLSAALSATMASARTAATAVAGEIDVRVVDSRSITLGLGTQVVVAAEAAAAGMEVDEVEALAVDLAGRTKVWGALDTLNNLKKGGRIGGAQALLGSLLSIKPCIDISTGKVEEAGRARTRRKAIQWLANKVLAEPTVEHLCVVHGGAPADAETLCDLLAPRCPRDTITVGTIGPVIGTHGGPRVLGVTYLLSSPGLASP
jgi:DegV family protein with EDD domain